MILEHISISPGNSKTGYLVPSVSLPQGVFCPQDAPCFLDGTCYVKNIDWRPSVFNAYERNYKILMEDPEQYWREVDAAIKMNLAFRYHVSGEIPDMAYFCRMIREAEMNPHCHQLVFTKKYSIVNDYFDEHGIESKPNNLQIIFSVWEGFPIDNHYCFPEARILYDDMEITSEMKVCGGNCSECKCRNTGCWVLRYGEAIYLPEHSNKNKGGRKNRKAN